MESLEWPTCSLASRLRRLSIKGAVDDRQNPDTERDLPALIRATRLFYRFEALETLELRGVSILPDHFFGPRFLGAPLTTLHHGRGRSLRGGTRAVIFGHSC